MITVSFFYDDPDPLEGSPKTADMPSVPESGDCIEFKVGGESRWYTVLNTEWYIKDGVVDGLLVRLVYEGEN